MALAGQVGAMIEKYQLMMLVSLIRSLQKTLACSTLNSVICTFCHFFALNKLTRHRVSVDIYHTDPRHPRFAYVQYQTIDSGDEAINTLHQRPIDFSSAYNVENAEDLAGWAGWDGAMTVVRNEGGRFIPTDVETSFPGVAAWMIGGEKLQAQGQEVQGQNGAKDGGDGEGAREEEVIEAESRKRDRERVEGGEQGNGEQV